MQVAANSALAAERDAADTEEAERAKNVAQATYKASQASMRSQEAAEAAAAAEKLALEAAEHAKRAGTAQAFDHALAAAQAFNQASSCGVVYCWSLGVHELTRSRWGTGPEAIMGADICRPGV